MFKVINLKKIIKVLFFIYILLLIYVLFLKSEYRLNLKLEFLSNDHISYCLNLKPFATIKRYIKAYINNNIELNVFIENIFGNFVLFMPLSLFINYKFHEIKILHFSMFLLFIIILIEFLQFILVIGIADIDDVILNFTGSFICISFCKFYKKLLEKK